MLAACAQVSVMTAHEAGERVPLVAPSVVPALDPLFRPAALAWRAFQQRAQDTGRPVPVRFALEQKDGSVSRFSATLLPESDPAAAANFGMLERLVKLALWSRGGFRIHLDAPAGLVERLRAHFRDSPTGRFDSEIVGERVYEHPIEVVATKELPPERSTTTSLGGHLDGCRIGFDLGGSDRKVAAIIDGQVVCSEEIEWDPYHQPDPQYHWDGIMDSLPRAAAAHLPHVDAIGGSAAGVYVHNQVRFASLFRGVPPDVFEQRVKNIFLDLRARLERRPLRGGQRRRRHCAARVDVARRWRRGAGDRARHQHRGRLRHRRRQHHAVAQRDRLRSRRLPPRRAPRRVVGRPRLLRASTSRSRRWAGCSARPASTSLPRCPFPHG